MSALIAFGRELAGLFVDDGSLALAILGIIAVAALLARLLPDQPLVAGAILLFGCLGALIANVARAARSKPAP
ncbi:MAG: hypothetical protein JWQ17_3281 [Tardiphaga sp.]|jgi:hypothetical protein|nr:hypothetical protein [Tardiphaga sp.]